MNGFALGLVLKQRPIEGNSEMAYFAQKALHSLVSRAFHLPTIQGAREDQTGRRETLGKKVGLQLLLCSCVLFYSFHELTKWKKF